MAAAREPFNATASTHSDVNLHSSAWKSPVPYLFGGLAAMMGLIAFALLILACSYWKLSGYLENEGEGSGQAERDLEAGDGAVPVPVMEQKVLVIMAGQVKPTFLATPSFSSRSSSFGEKICRCNENGDELEVLDQGEKQVCPSGSSDDAAEVPRQSRGSTTTNQSISSSRQEN